jgi:hypothetical protein
MTNFFEGIIPIFAIVFVFGMPVAVVWIALNLATKSASSSTLHCKN